jgi:hypothetical protein
MVNGAVRFSNGFNVVRVRPPFWFRLVTVWVVAFNPARSWPPILPKGVVHMATKAIVRDVGGLASSTGSMRTGWGLMLLLLMAPVAHWAGGACQQQQQDQ